MEKLRETVMNLATAEQRKPLYPTQIAHIEQQLHRAFPAGLHTPNHPAYAAMIYKAITELNEEGGSSEESISEYIKANYKELPWAHKSLLNHHLRKLSNKGFVVLTADKRYLISGTAVAVGKRRRIKRKYGTNHITTTPECLLGYGMNEDNCLENEESDATAGRKRNKASRRLVFDKEDEDELCNAVTTEEIVRNNGESSKGLAKRKKKDMVKWMVNAFSDLSIKSPDQIEESKCVAMPEKKSEEQPTELMLLPRVTLHEHDNEQQNLTLGLQGNKITDHRKRKQPFHLQSLVRTIFFGECNVHSDANNSKCHSYCLECMNGALCTFCRTLHKDHDIIRISRTMWENAVAASRIQMHIDISEIQTHFVSGRFVISLKRTVPSRHRKHFSGACFICKRHLPDSFKFCSLSCKIEHELACYALPETN